jgi:hypothetical protein
VLGEPKLKDHSLFQNNHYLQKLKRNQLNTDKRDLANIFRKQLALLGQSRSSGPRGPVCGMITSLWQSAMLEPARDVDPSWAYSIQECSTVM